MRFIFRNINKYSGFGYIFFVFVSFLDLNGQIIHPIREFRGVWMATVNNIDYPTSPKLSVEKQKEELIAYLDFFKQQHINAVIFQVRPAADAFYKSESEPWSHWLTGKQGKSPKAKFDPLEFIVEECHKRQIELHAWVNPFRVISFDDDNDADPSYITRRHPEWIVNYNNQKVLNPGLIEVRAYLTQVIIEIATNYDVDAIHFDDYFYPYPNNETTFPDEKEFKKYGKKHQSIEDWRRNNIDCLIQSIHDTLQVIKPKLKFGISPFGIWRNKTTDSLGSSTYGLESYDAIYADSRKWLQKGWIDYIVPQIYWSQKNRTANYDTLSQWWSRNTFGKHLYIGHSLYKIKNETRDSAWYNINEIPNQITTNRSSGAVQGSVLFRAKLLFQNSSEIRDSLRKNVFVFPALIPSMPWKDSVPPESPKNLNIKRTKKGNKIKWNHSETAPDGDKPYFYIIYRFGKQVFSSKNPQSILAFVDSRHNEFIDTAKEALLDSVEYGITAIDRLYNESAICLKNFKKSKSKTLRATLYFDRALVSRQFEVPLNNKPVTIIIEDLPADIDPSTIEFSSEHPIEVISYKAKKYRYNADVIKELSKKVSDSIEFLKNKCYEIKDSLEINLMMEAMLLKNQEFNKNNTNIDFEDIKNLNLFFSKQMYDLRAQRRRLENQYYKDSSELIILKNRYKMAKIDSIIYKTKIEVSLVANDELNALINISFLSGAASWTPHYKLFAEDSSDFKLEYWANICQHTNESWDNVDISLISKKYPNRESDITVNNSLSYSVNEQKSVELPYIFYKSRDKISINSGDTALYLQLATKTIPIQYVYQAELSSDNEVKRVAEIPDWERLQLYPAWFKIYYDGNLMQQTYCTLQNDTLQFEVLPESFVKIRKQLIDSTQTINWWTKVLNQHKEVYEIKALNKKAESIALTIIEYLSKLEKEDLILKRFKTNETPYYSNKKEIQWKYKLNPLETKTFTITYIYKRRKKD